MTHLPVRGRRASASVAKSEQPTCSEIIEPFIRAISDRADLPRIQVIGGNSSAALVDARTLIDLDAQEIAAPGHVDLPRFRPDNSLRDFDMLVLSSDPDDINRVEVLAKECIEDQLVVSVFGLKTIADLEKQRSRPWWSSARIFLGDRYVLTSHDPSEDAVGFHGFKALYPFRTAMTTDSFETFGLSIGDTELVPTPHPGATILNYLTRSISGLRVKDAEKVEAMSENVLTRYPEIRDWIYDGPGRATLDLARILHTLREPRGGQRILHVGSKLQIVPYSLSELLAHDGFMASDRPAVAQRAIVEVARLKSHLLGRSEASATVVSLWQKHVEVRLKPFLNNEARP